jgi:hypothetical protein
LDAELENGSLQQVLVDKEEFEDGDSKPEDYFVRAASAKVRGEVQIVDNDGVVAYGVYSSE